MSHIHITLEHVNFSYDHSSPILQDITFTANEHDTIGLIGANGVGKSTLLKLLVGLTGQKRAPAPVAWMIIFLLLKQYFCFLNSISASHK